VDALYAERRAIKERWAREDARADTVSADRGGIT
jgi:hypothetical protein